MPDGYTILLASPAEVVINPHLYARMPFDPTKDLAPVTKIASAPLVLVVTLPCRCTPIENWQGIFVPASTPAEIVARLSRDIAAVAAEKDFAARLTAAGAAPSTMAPAQFANFVRAEYLKYARLVKESGAKVEVRELRRRHRYSA